jgi:ribonuclease HII
MEVVVRTKADRDCVSVAAASVVAKVERDNHMIQLASSFEGYGLDGHKGYASASHIVAVRSLGPSPEHRLTWLTKILATDPDPSKEGSHWAGSNEAVGRWE